MQRIFDTHCHLTSKDFDEDRWDCISRAQTSGIAALSLICADPQNLEEVPLLQSEIQHRFPELKVVFAAGLHPHEAKEITEALWKKIEDLCQGSAAAVGETGLDYYYKLSDEAIQKEYFQRHIELASVVKKPLVIHCREAAADMIQMLDQDCLKSHPQPGVIHCFTESLDFAKKVLDLGFMISFSGIITFKNAAALREVVSYVPLDRLLVETDAPWLAPIPYRGKRNEPSHTTEVLAKVCELRSEPHEQISEQIWLNSCKFYGVSP